ncbi:MAG: hypothetical protein HN337_07225 [Deltaproteobacteria bacterium]|nr:hypothetical protein [Deltaproteobacteria bacterium]
MLYLSDARRWLGGLRSVHALAAAPHSKGPDKILVSKDLVKEGELVIGRNHRVELLM